MSCFRCTAHRSKRIVLAVQPAMLRSASLFYAWCILGVIPSFFFFFRQTCLNGGFGNELGTRTSIWQSTTNPDNGASCCHLKRIVYDYSNSCSMFLSKAIRGDVPHSLRKRSLEHPPVREIRVIYRRRGHLVEWEREKKRGKPKEDRRLTNLTPSQKTTKWRFRLDLGHRYWGGDGSS